MNKIIKYLGLSAFAVAGLISLSTVFAADTTHAQVSRSMNRNYRNINRNFDRDRDRDRGRDRDRDRDRDHSRNRNRFRNYNRHRGKIYSDYNYFTRHNLFRRYDRFRHRFPGNICARNYRFIDRHDRYNTVYYDNYYGDNDCVNTVYVYVDSDFLNNFRYNLSINNDLDFRINTGDNTISYNTIVGDVVTGGASIEIY